jgi:RNA polymerase sigma-70 factor (ECF subfamily)
LDKSRLDGDFLGLLNEHRGAIHRVCRTYAAGADDREDLFQEIVYQLWRAFASYRHEAAPITWVYRISLNAAITALRKRSRRPLHVSLDATSDLPSPPTSRTSDERVELLYRAIRSLGEIERGLLMCYLDGLSYKQIGEVLGISESNVGARLSRGRSKLQELVKETG